jgi:AraC-like DNA-binding protein
MPMMRVHTHELPARERFDRWREVTGSMLAPVEIRSAHAADFAAEARLVDLGGPVVTSVTCPSYQASRTSRLIRSSDPEAYQVSVNLDSRSTLAVGRAATVHLRPGELLLYDTSQPFEGHAVPRPGQEFATGFMVSLPRTLLPLPGSALRKAIPLVIPGATGVGAVLSGFLGDLMRHAPEMSPVDTDRMSAVLVDLVAAAVAGRLEQSMPDGARRRSLQAAARRFIRENLSDVDLTPAAVAAALHISPRYLYQLFSGQAGVAAWIRAQRLERCRRDLADPGLAGVPVAAVARRWGLTDTAHFSRAFSAKYGKTPREYRLGG